MVTVIGDSIVPTFGYLHFCSRVIDVRCVVYQLVGETSRISGEDGLGILCQKVLDVGVHREGRQDQQIDVTWRNVDQQVHQAPILNIVLLLYTASRMPSSLPTMVTVRCVVSGVISSFCWREIRHDEDALM